MREDRLKTQYSKIKSPPGGREVFLGIRGGGVPPGSPNPDPTSDPKIDIFHTRTFSDLASKIHTRFQTCGRQKLCHHYLD